VKEFYIGQLRTDDEIQDYFMVKAIAIKIGSNKKQYLDMVVCDNSGELTAKKWDVADPELPALNEIGASDIVKLKGNVTEWNGMRQLRVQKLRKAVPEDHVELMDFIKARCQKPPCRAGGSALSYEKNADDCGKSLRSLSQPEQGSRHHGGDHS